GLTAAKLGPGYQILEDISLMASLPNMAVVCPADYRETEAILSASLQKFGPVYIRLPIGKYSNVFEGKVDFEFGKSHVIRDGKDICVFTMGPLLHRAIEASEALEKEGVSVRIVNLSSIKPLDKEQIIESAKKCKICVSIEDHNVIGGLGSRVSEVLSEVYPGRLFRIGMEDKFGEAIEIEELYRRNNLDTDSLIHRLKEYAKM
ncbi:transketolase family protein, partial [Candidatus Peregrinibacteria bacterium]|nr:transketolase family protein [Candidatus Peregrinibacteria bacterium]